MSDLTWFGYIRIQNFIIRNTALNDDNVKDLSQILLYNIQNDGDFIIETLDLSNNKNLLTGWTDIADTFLSSNKLIVRKLVLKNCQLKNENLAEIFRNLKN